MSNKSEFMKGMEAGLKEAELHKEPSNKTIELVDHMKDAISDIKSSQVSQKEILIRVEEKVTATNGRVRKLETFRATTYGALSILTVLVVPILIFMIQQYILDHNNDDKIAEMVVNKLMQDNEIIIEE